MKVLLIIDHFGSGGAQRQMVELACGLKRRGHTVEMFVYFPQYNFFRARIDEQRIPVHEQPGGRAAAFEVIRRLASVMRSGVFDVAASYLSSANIYAELARVAARDTRLVVSERTSHYDDRSAIGALARRILYLLSDRVVANSESQAAWLKTKPWLRARVRCICNGVDLSAFQTNESIPSSGPSLRLLGIGRIGPEKNLLNLITALARFEDQFGYVPEIGWAGQQDSSRAGQRYCARVDALLASLPKGRQRGRGPGL